MAIIGVSRLYCAKYNNNNGAISYSDGGLMAKITKVNISVEAGSDNDFYADNAIDETDAGFAGGDYSVTPADLTQQASKLILGIQAQELTGANAIDGVTDEGAEELIYDDRQNTPFLGIGNIIKVMRGGVIKWRAVVLTKVKFNVPAEAAETQGKTISWQTNDLAGKIFRDDTEYHAWKKEATFTTEAQAEAYVRDRLNIATA